MVAGSPMHTLPVHVGKATRSIDHPCSHFKSRTEDKTQPARNNHTGLSCVQANTALTGANHCLHMHSHQQEGSIHSCSVTGHCCCASHIRPHATAWTWRVTAVRLGDLPSFFAHIADKLHTANHVLIPKWSKATEDISNTVTLS